MLPSWCRGLISIVTSRKQGFGPRPIGALVPVCLEPELMCALVPVSTARTSARAWQALVPVQWEPLVPVGDINRD
jgi:hypothetical protein